MYIQVHNTYIHTCMHKTKCYVNIYSVSLRDLTLEQISKPRHVKFITNMRRIIFFSSSQSIENIFNDE